MRKFILLLLIGLLPVISIFAQAPGNDNCSGAIMLTVNTDNQCAVSTEGTSIGASQSQPGCNFNVADDDVWYKFTATDTSHKISVSALSMSDPIFEVFSGTCGSLVSLGCVNDLFFPYNHTEKATLSGLNIGDVYYLRVHSAGSAAFTKGTFSICIGVPAPPSNDNCATPTVLTINENQSCAIVTNATSEDATESLTGCYNGSIADDDVWFSFTATQTAHFIKITSGTINVPVLEIFKGACENIESIYCELQYNNNTGFKIGELVPGQTYLIRVYSYYGHTQAGSFSLCINEPMGMPANDACSGALALTANTASCSTFTTADLENATGAYDATCVGDKIKDDVWFKFTATDAEMVLKMLNQSISSPQMELFSGTCGSLSQILCADYGFMAVSNLTIGQEYYLRVWSRYGVSARNGGFDMCLSTTSANDDISSAVVLQANNDFTCTLTNVGDNLFALSNLPVSNYNAFCAPIINGAWYKFIALNDSLEISLTPQSNSGPTMEVFHMVSGNPVFLQASDQKVILIDAVPGDEYYILVYNCTTYPLSRGTYEICIKNVPPPPVNDNCSTAIALTVNNDLTCNITTEGTTQNALGEEYGCSGSPDDDVWYSFVATATEHQITVTPGTMSDPAFALFSGSCGVLNELLCENNSCCGDPEVNKVTGLTIGETYFVQVYSSNLYSDQGTFTICINLPVPVPVNEECANAVELLTSTTCTGVSGTNFNVQDSDYDGCEYYKSKVWYKFTADELSTKVIQVTRGSIQNVFIDVFQGGCDNLSRVGNCEYNTHNEAIVQSVQNGLVDETNYYVSVSTTETSDQGTFDICVFSPQTPANDECAAAIALTVNSGNTPTIKTAGSTFFATQSQTACSGTADDDVWYSFTATQTAHRIYLQNNTSNTNAVLEVFSGSCGALVNKQCISSGFNSLESSSTKLTNLTIGQTYFIRVHTSGTTDNFNFNIGITSSPLNDNCSEAILLNPGSGDGFLNAQTGSSVDASLSSNDCNNLTTTDDDVWYKFTASQKIHRIKLQGWQSNFGRIEAFSGSCGALVSLGCNQISISGDTIISTLNNLTANETYFFRVYSSSTTAFQSAFSLAVSTPAISTIDDCADAQLIPVSNNAQCTNTIVSSSNAFPSNMTGTCNNVGNDIYLKFVATSAQHQIKVASHNFTSFTVNFLSGSCGSFQTLGCRSSLDSISNLGNLNIGQTYYIRIITSGNISDLYNVCITTPAFASNDECAGAINMVAEGDAITCIPLQGDFQNSSQSLFQDCGTSPSVSSSLFKDVWYKFTASANYQRFRMAKISGGTFKFELYSGTCGTLTFIECTSSINTFAEKTFTNLTPGGTYYIRVFTSSANNIEFEYCLRAIVPPDNDTCIAAKHLFVHTDWKNENYVGGSTLDASPTIGSNTCGQANSYAVYYNFIATTASQNVVFSLPNYQIGLNGMVVSVYAGTCETPTPVLCKIADFVSTKENVMKLTGLSIGQTYLIKVYSNEASITKQGYFNIQVNSQTQAPDNDACSMAESLTIYPKSTAIVFKEGNTAFATTSTESLQCTSLGTADDDIWFKFIATKTRVRVILNADFNSPNVAVYSGSCGSLISLNCFKPDNSSERNLNKVIENLTIGQTYSIRVFSSANSASTRGKVKIGLSDDTDVPVNDLCSNAIPLTISANNIPDFIIGTTENANAESSSCSGGADVFYKFTATASQLRLNYEGYIEDVKICLLAGTCGNTTTFTSMSPVHGEAVTASGLTIGVEYFISVGSNSGSEAVGNFKIAVTTPVIPQNDLCSTAIPLLQGSYHTTNLATADTPDCYYKPKSDIWFTMMATQEKMKVIVENLNTNSAITVYSGSCGALSQVACTYVAEQFSLKNNILNLSALTVGETYFVRVITTGEYFSNPFYYEIPLEFRIYTEENPEANENPLFDLTCISTNLVPNPGFEYFETCPSNFIPSPATAGQWLSPNNFWKIPTMGSSDYFNDCAAFDASIENSRNNTFGFQNPRNGTAFGGVYTGGPSEYREYLSTKLSSSMEIGKKYLLSMYVSRADYYAYASNNMGFGLDTKEKSVLTLDTLLLEKVILPVQNNVIIESENWVNISASFVADKAYTHLYLGNFSSEKNTISQSASDISGGGSGGYNENYSDNAYYFIDDIFVGEVQNTIACGANDCNSILVLSSPTDDIMGGIVNKNSNLEVKANIIIQGSSNVLFNSGKSILMDGQNGVFEIKNGVVFEAKIGGCAN